MHRAKRWASALVLAAFTGAAVAAEQPAMLPPADPPVSVSTANVTLEARDVEMLVEIELLADPATFAHTIKARMGPNGLELKGFVPNETIRKRAVAIADSIFPGVVDQLRVQSNLALPAPKAVSGAFMDNAKTRIAKACPDSRGISVKTAMNGTVTLTGRVDSLEDKWKCSAALRGLPGCLSIKNDLDAPNAPVIQRDPPAKMPGVAGVPQTPMPSPEMPSTPYSATPMHGVPHTPMPPVEVARPAMSTVPGTGRSMPAPLLPESRPDMPVTKIEPRLPGTPGAPAITPPGTPVTAIPGKPVGLTTSPYAGESGGPITHPPVAVKPVGMPKSPVAPTPMPAAPKPATGSGTPAIITFDEEPASAAKNPTAKGPTREIQDPMVRPASMTSGTANLQRQIKANLGFAAKEITVSANADGGYRVMITHRPNYDAGAMFQMIKHLPELMDSKSSVEFSPAK